MTEKDFPPCILFVNTGKKLTLEEIKEQVMVRMTQEPLISDEEAFERHLIRKWAGDDRKYE